MSPKSEIPRVVTLVRRFDAPIELVYRAWTEAEHVVKWMKCDLQATLEVDNWVAEPGVEFQTHMSQPGVFEATSRGRFTIVEPPRLLEYVIYEDPKLGVPEMTVRVELEEQSEQEGGGTVLTLTQSGIPSDFIFGIISGGWTASLSQLDTILAQGPAAPETTPAEVPE